MSRTELTGSINDRPRSALALAGATAVLLPSFFLAATPELRTTGGVVWFIGAGLLLGAAVYFNRRAVNYRKEPPRGWGIPRQFRTLNPGSYLPAGRIFARRQLISLFALLVWWLVIGPLFFLSIPSP